METSLASDVDSDSLKSLVRVNIVVKRDSLTTRIYIVVLTVVTTSSTVTQNIDTHCEHTDQRMVDNQLVCLRCGLRFTGPPPIPFVRGERNKCEHPRLERVYGATRFCSNCGLDSKYIPPDDTCGHNHLIEKNGEPFCTNCGLFVGYESIDDLCIPLTYYAEIQENKAKLNEHSKVKDLREAATKAGVKRVTAMSKKQLCKAVGIKNSNEGKYILKNLKTGEDHRLKNQKEIADKFGICQGSLSFLLKKGRVNVNGDTYPLEKN